MKQFLMKKKIPLLFIAIFLFLFIIGQLYSNYMVKQIAVHEDENIAFEITGFDYNFDVATMAQYPYLVHVTLSNDGTSTLYMSSSRVLSGIQSGDAVSNRDLLDIQAAVSSANMGINPTTRALEYRETERSLTVVSAGFHGNIEVTVTFSADFTTVSYDPLDIHSSESYAASTNVTVPAVESYYLNGLVAGNIQLDAYAGASQGTSPAMQSIVMFISAFMTEQAGGGSNE